jgi:DNA-binding LacI/PurR family transcriptional regulator
MTDVAQEAGVSVVTVSYVFSRPQRVSPGIRELVVQAARRLNYHGPDPAARSLARGRSNSVGVGVGEGLTYAFDDLESARFLVGVAAVCVEYQQNMVLIPPALGVLDIIDQRGWRVPGDVTVSGWDDSPAAAHHDLTSVRQSLEEQGTLCALVVLGHEGQREPLVWRLVERGSTRRRRSRTA